MKKLLSFVILLSVCLFMNAQAFHKVSDKDKALLKLMKPVTPQVGLTLTFIIKDDNDKFMFGISGFI